MTYRVYGEFLNGARQYIDTFDSYDRAVTFLSRYQLRPNPYHGFSIDTVFD